MKACTERKIIRWIHIIFSIPIVGYIYGPVSQLEPGATVVRFAFFPTIVLSGLWLWKGSWVKKTFSRTSGETFIMPLKHENTK